MCAIRGVTYDRVDSGERQTGVIAQEVQAVLPEAVSGDDILGVAYGNMAGLFVEAIKELSGKIASLESEIAQMKMDLSGPFSFQSSITSLQILSCNKSLMQS